MLPKHDRTRQSHLLAMIRDVVEVVAIIAAGFWAFYVFIYENRILPSQAQPNVNITASLQRVSEHNGLIGVRMNTEVRNIGTVQVHFFGIATAVTGERIAPMASPGPQAFQSNVVFAPYFRATKPVVVYEIGYVTRLGDPSVTTDLPLEAGQDDQTQTIFYVPKGAFDRLRVYITASFARGDQKSIPTRMVTNERGLPAFIGPSSETDGIGTYSSSVTSLDLNGR